MKLIFDPHVHIYPLYDIKSFFVSLIKNFQNTRPLKSIDEKYAICLTERPECHYYEDLKTQSIFPVLLHDGFLELSVESYSVLVFPGKQINSTEGLEVLGLFLNTPLPANESLPKILESIITENGIPVINWAPGKWSGKRGHYLRTCYTTLPEKALLGYTKLLPHNFALPNLIQESISKNRPVVFGSDPLPIQGELGVAGSCGMVIDVQNITNIDSIRNSIYESPISYFGERSSLHSTVIRLFKNEFQRRRPKNAKNIR